MTQKKLELSSSCEFELFEYSNGEINLSLDYVEHATDHYSSDNTTSIDIDRDKAKEIIDFLLAAYNL
jgi:hypothetical protein